MAIAEQNGAATAPVLDERIAVTANAAHEVPRLLDEVAVKGKALAQNEPRARQTLLESARALVYALETPREAMIRICWSQVGALS
jgi:hypothetical protein